MDLPKDLLASLACPKCHDPVRVSRDDEGVVCGKCRLLYPIRQDIPIMMIDQAVPLGQVGEGSMRSAMSGKVLEIEVVEGHNKGLTFKMPKGTCRAIGRALEDTERTQVIDEHAVIGLDDSTKQIILNYITQQLGEKETGSSSTASDLGSFQRLPDLSLTDNSISRLHAMLFHGPGGLGILDLVSKNGTFVNGVEVESKFLDPDDIITIGHSKLRLRRS